MLFISSQPQCVKSVLQTIIAKVYKRGDDMS